MSNVVEREADGVLDFDEVCVLGMDGLTEWSADEETECEDEPVFDSCGEKVSVVVLRVNVGTRVPIVKDSVSVAAALPLLVRLLLTEYDRSKVTESVDVSVTERVGVKLPCLFV